LKVIYCGYRGTYGAFLFAAFHLGFYKENSIPEKRQIEKHFEICRLYGEQYGNLIYVGVDEELREVYILGCKRYFSVVKKAQMHINKMFHLDDTIYHVDVRKKEGILPRIIGFLLAHRINRVICRKLFSYWIVRKYPCVSNATKTVKERLKTMDMKKR